MTVNTRLWWFKTSSFEFLQGTPWLVKRPERARVCLFGTILVLCIVQYIYWREISVSSISNFEHDKHLRRVQDIQRRSSIDEKQIYTFIVISNTSVHAPIEAS